MWPSSRSRNWNLLWTASDGLPHSASMISRNCINALFNSPSTWLTEGVIVIIHKAAKRTPARRY